MRGLRARICEWPANGIDRQYEDGLAGAQVDCK